LSTDSTTGHSHRTEIDALRERLERTEAILAIQALKAEYADLVDRRFSLGKVLEQPMLDEVVDQICGLFTPDAAWDGGPVLGVASGRHEIAERMRKPTLVFSRHLFTKPRIQVDPPEASARWDLLCPCKTPDGRSWWMCGYEDDEYSLDEGVWRHSKMRLTTVFMTPVGGGFDRLLV
jgi:SnoaL-like domain